MLRFGKKKEIANSLGTRQGLRGLDAVTSAFIPYEYATFHFPTKKVQFFFLFTVQQEINFKTSD